MTVIARTVLNYSLNGDYDNGAARVGECHRCRTGQQHDNGLSGRGEFVGGELYSDCDRRVDAATGSAGPTLP